MRRRTAAVTVVVAAALLPATSPAAGAVSQPVAPAIDLPISRVTDAISDPLHHRAYVASRSQGRVLSVDLTSGASTRLPHLPGASDLALDPTGDYLWVSLKTEGEVARVSTTATDDVDYFEIGADDSCPGDLVAAAGRVYVLTDTCDGQYTELMVLDPVSGDVRRSDAQLAYPFDPQLFPIEGTTRFLWQSRYTSFTPSAVVDATSDDVVAQAPDTNVLALSSDGTRALDWNGDVLSTTDLGVIATWDVPSGTDLHVGDAAPGPDGLLAIPGNDAMTVYDTATSTSRARWLADTTGTTPVRHAVWDGDALFGVTGDGPASLVMIGDPVGIPTSILEVAEPAVDEWVSEGGTWTVRGRLTDGEGAAIADAPVEVRDPTSLLGSTTTSADGSWSVEVVVPVEPIRAVFPGDETHDPAVASVRVPLTSQKFLTVEGPATALPTDVLHYEGRVVTRDGRPLADEEIGFWWGCRDKYVEGVLLTDDAGAFFYDLHAPRCEEVEVSFDVRRSPDASAYGVVTTELQWRVAQLIATGPDRLSPGETGTWTATLTVDGQPAAGQPVEYYADESGTPERGSLTTDAGGVVRLTTDSLTPRDSGIVFHFLGDATTLDATAVVPTEVSRWPSVLNATASPSPAVVGTRVSITGTLALGDASSAAGRIITLSRSSNQLDSTTVGADGSFQLLDVPPYTTSPGTMNYVVDFEGDGSHTAAEVIVRVVVEQQPTTLTSHIAAPLPDDGRARVVAAADPGYAGMCLTHRLDRRTSDGWRTVRTTGCRATDDHGRSSFRTPVLRSGATYRVRARFDGDERTAADLGAWKRFRAG